MTNKREIKWFIAEKRYGIFPALHRLHLLNALKKTKRGSYILDGGCSSYSGFNFLFSHNENVQRDIAIVANRVLKKNLNA